MQCTCTMQFIKDFYIQRSKWNRHGSIMTLGLICVVCFCLSSRRHEESLRKSGLDFNSMDRRYKFPSISLFIQGGGKSPWHIFEIHHRCSMQWCDTIPIDTNELVYEFDSIIKGDKEFSREWVVERKTRSGLYRADGSREPTWTRPVGTP